MQARELGLIVGCLPDATGIHNPGDDNIRTSENMIKSLIVFNDRWGLNLMLDVFGFLVSNELVDPGIRDSPQKLNEVLEQWRKKYEM